MSEPDQKCSRCREPIESVTARIAIESGPLCAAHPVLELCEGCSYSMGRWLARRGRGRSRGGSGGEHSHRDVAHGDAALYATHGGDVVVWADGARGRLIVIMVVVLLALVLGGLAVSALLS